MSARLVSVCAFVAAAGIAMGSLPTIASAQEAVYLVRHAERLDDTTDPPLSGEGSARATRLGGILRDAGITAIFSTQYRRTVDTATPLAERLGVPVVQIKAGQTAELLQAVRAAGPRARVLIVGHSDTVPELLAALGDTASVTIAKVEYDNLFLVIPRDKAAPVVVRLRF